MLSCDLGHRSVFASKIIARVRRKRVVASVDAMCLQTSAMGARPTRIQRSSTRPAVSCVKRNVAARGAWEPSATARGPSIERSGLGTVGHRRTRNCHELTSPSARGCRSHQHGRVMFPAAAWSDIEWPFSQSRWRHARQAIDFFVQPASDEGQLQQHGNAAPACATIRPVDGCPPEPGQVHSQFGKQKRTGVTPDCLPQVLTTAPEYCTESHADIPAFPNADIERTILAATLSESFPACRSNRASHRATHPFNGRPHRHW